MATRLSRNPRRSVEIMPRWWQVQLGFAGLVFHDVIILSPPGYSFNPGSKWAHFKFRRRDKAPSPQKISNTMFRRLHPSRKRSVNINCRAEMRSLPERPGCYAVIRDKQVLYVGASSNLRERCSRLTGKGDASDRLYFWLWRFPFSLEYHLISFLAPRENCQGKFNRFPTICAWSGIFREELDN